MKSIRSLSRVKRQAVWPVRLLLCLALVAILAPRVYAESACVVLLHGLARTADSMGDLATALTEEGYTVANIDYQSRHARIEELSPVAVGEGIDACLANEPEPSEIHFVTHSLGGILVRYYFAENELQSLGRVVMLAPPNQGSAVVDDWRNVPGYSLINGPAGLQLGTDADSVPLSLGPVEFELGVIAADKTNNPILSLSLENPDDGKVSVESTKVEGMTDFVLVPSTHSFVMSSDAAIRQVKTFLKTGGFEPVTED